MRISSLLVIFFSFFSISAAQPVEVIRALPDGEGAANIRQISLLFNQKMVPLGRMERTAQELGITVSPEIKCQWRWLDPTSLACQLDDSESLKPANEYTLTLNPGLKSESGSKLAKPFVLKFSTARPKATYANFRTWTHPGNPQIHVSFNQKVKIDEAVRLMRLKMGQQTASVKQVIDPHTKDGMGVIIEPVSPLPLDTDVQLSIVDGLVSLTGPLKGYAHDVVKLRTFPEFQFTGIECQNEQGHGVSFTASGTGQCSPLSGVRLMFTSPIQNKELKSKMKVTPPLAAAGKEEDVWQDDSYYNRLSSPHRAGGSYPVSLPRFLLANKDYHLKADDIRDQFDRKLKQPIDFKFKTTSRPSSMTLINRESVLERDEKTEVPVYVTNLNSITARFGLLTTDGITTGTHTIKVPKFEDNAFAIPLEVRKMTKEKSGVIEGTLHPDPTGHSSTSLRFASQVTSFQVVAKVGHLASVVWVTDLVTGQGVSGAKVTIHIVPNESVQIGQDLVTGVTDKDGLVKLSGYVTWPKLDSNSSFAVRVVKNKDLALLPLTYTYTSNVSTGDEYYGDSGSDFGDWGDQARDISNYGSPKWSYLQSWGATAQGLYKSGENVQYKFYVRDQSNRHLIPAPKESYEIVITDPKGDKAFKKSGVVLNEFGAFAGEFKLSPTAPVGWYNVMVTPSYTSRRLRPFRFLVADFTPVPFKVEVQAVPKKVKPDDVLKIDTFATFHAGGPFGNAPARLVGLFNRQFYRSKNQAVSDFTFDSYTAGYDQPEIFNEQKTLDAKGGLHHEYKVPKFNGNFGNILVEGAIQDDRGKNSANLTSVEYNGLNRRVGLKQTKWSNKVSEKVNILYTVVDENGDPVKGTDVTLVFKHQEIKSAKVKGAGNAYLTNYTTEYVDVGQCKGKSETKPSTCDFVPKKPGAYQAVATIADTVGRQHSVTAFLYVSGPGQVTWEYGQDQSIKIIPEKTDYNVGETAKFLVQNPYPGAKALITVERIGVIKSWTMEMKDSAQLIELPLEDDFVPGFHLTVSITSPRVKQSEPIGQIDLGKPAARFGAVVVQVKDPYKQIKVQTKTDKTEYRPREKVKVRLNAKPLHPRSPAEPTELAVVVLDEAVLNLIRGQDKYFDIYQGFYDQTLWDVQVYSLINALVGRQKFEKKGASAGGAGGLSGPISVRDLFKYVAYWNPSLKPDKNGDASFDFTLPDNLTGWRVLTMAVTPTDRMGLGQGSFKTNKPTEIRPVLPNQVTEGDQFKAGFSILNRTDKTRKINWRIQAQGQVQSASPVLQTGVVELGSFERKSVFAEIKASQVKEMRDSKGEISFTVAAGDSVDKDGLSHIMPVHKKRSFETAAAYGTTTEKQVTESVLFPKEIYSDVGAVSVTLAPSVIANVEGAFRYIQNYPHLCWEQRLTKATMASHYLKLKAYVPGVKWDQAQSTIQPLIDSAASFQAPNGGMTYWNSSDPFVSPYLSAYTAVAFQWLREAGHKIPEDVELRLHTYLKNYLRSQVQTTFFDEGMRSTVRAIALYALAKSKSIDAAEVKRFMTAMPSMSLFGQAHYLMAAMIIGDTSAEQEKTLKTILNKSSQTSGKFTFNETLTDGYRQLLSTPTRDNCAVLSALVKAEVNPQQKILVSDIPFRLVRSLTQTRGSRDHWENTQENLFCLQALIDYSKQYESQKPAFKAEALLDGKSFGSASFDAFSNPLKLLQRVIRPEDPGRKATVQITRTGQGRLYYATRVTFAPKEENADNVNSGLDVKREYYVKREQKWQPIANIASIKRGELVRVNLFVSVPTARNFVAISDPVPGGLEPVNRDLADTSQVDANEGAFENARASIYWSRSDWHEFDLQWSSFYHQELKHDFVRFYADYLAPGNYHLSYTAQAIATGVFSASPTHGEEMYDPDVFGKSKPARFTVTEK